MSITVAIVGSGPSGCYLAQALRKLLPASEVTVIDRLPVPYGLVRYGVAADHQGTKAVTKQFARLFEREGVAFLGHVALGQDIGLPALQELFDVVVLATGLGQDRSLGPAFDGLAGVYGAGAVTRLWNGHPDAAAFQPALGATVMVVGNGNVAMDVVRLLAKAPAELEGSDLAGPEVGGGVQQIHLVGRSPADQAKCDPAMVRELGKIAGLRVEAEAIPGDSPVAGAFAALSESAGAGKTLSLHFETQPLRPVTEAGRLTGVICRAGGTETPIPCDSVITAIGFDAADGPGRDALLAQAIDRDAGHLTERLYATGWFRRGPTGTIAGNRSDAKTVAARIAETAKAGGRPGRAGLLAALRPPTTDYAVWQRIDAAERANAAPSRVRAKFTTTEAMLAFCAPEGLPK